jgi:hypothetical protein
MLEKYLNQLAQAGFVRLGAKEMHRFTTVTHDMFFKLNLEDGVITVSVDDMGAIQEGSGWYSGIECKLNRNTVLSARKFTRVDQIDVADIVELFKKLLKVSHDHFNKEVVNG